MDKSQRFGLALSPVEKALVRRLVEHERLSAAAVVRRLIWRAAREAGFQVAQADVEQAWPGGGGRGLETRQVHP
jgi:hypothetical protein